MLDSARQHGCLPFVVEIVVALSVGDPFLRGEASMSTTEASDIEDINFRMWSLKSHIRSVDLWEMYQPHLPIVVRSRGI